MVFLAGIVLATVFIIPAAWFPFQLGKLAVFAVFIVLAVILFILGRGTQGLVRAHGFYLALLVGALPLSYLLSQSVAKTGALSITGYSVEVDTVLFTAIAFVVFLLSFGLFKTLRTVRMLAATVVWTLAGVVAFQWVVVLFGTSAIPFPVFADHSLNLAGKWNDLGLLTGLLAIPFLAYGELSRAPLVRRVALAVGLIATTLLLGIINFSVAWWFILTASIIIGLTAFMTQRTEERAERQSNPYAYSSWSQKIPWFSAAGVLVSIVFLLYGASINQNLTNRFPVSSLEVRPSYGSTYNVISAAREGSVTKSLVGTGPNTFSLSWIAHKPAEVNQSAFWNLDFNVGFSTLVTALGTVGLLGAMAWMIPFLLVLAGIIRAVRLSLLSREERVTALAVSLGALVLLGAVALYVPSPTLVLLAFVFSGAAFGYLWRQGRHVAAEEAQPSPLSYILGWVVIMVLLVVSVWSTWAVDRRFVAQAKNNAGAVSLQAGNADDALAQSKKSQGVEIISDNLHLSVEAGILKIQQLAKSKDAATPAVQKQFLDIASSTIATAKKLSDMYPNDYRSYLAVGRIYDLLATLKVQGAYQNAEQSYQKALSLNPSAPDIALTLARLEASQNNTSLTQKYLSQSLTLKPNYTDAIMLVVQLNIANNDIPSAIRAAQAAAQTAPGVAPIWFQLGLLYYAGGDTANAIAPLEAAIKIVPDYANAKYFLGLSYYAQKKTTEALKEFEDLAKSNPDNAEVKLILSNMRAGKAPFESAQPPITSTPVKRPVAPLNE
jgi:tetratricopeptide (TPR) repeat protein